MPNLIDIAQRFTERPPVALLYEERCFPERDLGSTCSRCAEACPTEAIVVDAKRLDGDAPAAAFGSVTKDGLAGPRIDDEACVRCGRCITACPTAALLAVAPFDDDALLDEAARAGAAARAHAKRARTATIATAEASDDDGYGESAVDGFDDDARQAGTCDADSSDAYVPTAGFVCERAALTARIDAERTVTLPCLGWVDEALIVHLACSGAQRIALLTAACSSCEHAAAAGHLPRTVSAAQGILDVWGIDARVSIVEAIDGVSAADGQEAVGEVSRRGLFSQARSALADAAADAASAQMEALIGRRAGDAVAPEPDRRRWQMLDDLHAAGLPDGDTVVPRCVAPRVSIDVDRCSGCALCAGFCPTQALRKMGKVAGGRTLLEFDPALCRDCGTCEDTCRYEALVREESLTVSELFSLEPRELLIPKRRVLPSRR